VYAGAVSFCPLLKKLVLTAILTAALQEGISIDWMSNVERFTVDDETVHLLLNKHQRHRGDTLNSRMFLFEKLV
jgi:hypothetical protein